MEFNWLNETMMNSITSPNQVPPAIRKQIETNAVKKMKPQLQQQQTTQQVQTPKQPIQQNNVIQHPIQPNQAQGQQQPVQQQQLRPVAAQPSINDRIKRIQAVKNMK